MIQNVVQNFMAEQAYSESLYCYEAFPNAICG